jgi:hypothetical protein
MTRSIFCGEADLAMRKSLEHNHSVKMMKKIDKVFNWNNIEALLMEHYEVGKSKEGADAYSPQGKYQSEKIVTNFVKNRVRKGQFVSSPENSKVSR